MDLNKDVPPWRRKSWRTRYSGTIRMQIQAKLAPGVHRGHICVLQCWVRCVAVCCSVFSVLQVVWRCVAVCCSVFGVLQRVTVCFSVWQCIAVCAVVCVAVCVVVCCSMLQWKNI